MSTPSAHLPYSRPVLVSDPAPIAPAPVPVGDYLDQERTHGITRTLHYLREGNPGRAHYELQRSFQRQLRIAGLGTLPVVTTTPAGRRTTGGAR